MSNHTAITPAEIEREITEAAANEGLIIATGAQAQAIRKIKRLRAQISAAKAAEKELSTVVKELLSAENAEGIMYKGELIAAVTTRDGSRSCDFDVLKALVTPDIYDKVVTVGKPVTALQIKIK